MSSAACHILLLEDDPEIATLFRVALNAAGFCNVRTSSSLAGARQCWHAQAGKFDVLLTDFSLPDGCATELIPEFVRCKPDLRVILMSGFSQEALDLEGSLARKLTVLQKPFMPEALVETMRAALHAAPSAV